MSSSLSIMFCNQYVFPFLVTLGYTLVTVKNSICRYIIEYNNSICNHVTRDIWSRNRIISIFSNIYSGRFSGYNGYIPYFYLYINMIRHEYRVTKNVTINTFVTGFGGYN